MSVATNPAQKSRQISAQGSSQSVIIVNSSVGEKINAPPDLGKGAQF